MEPNLPHNPNLEIISERREPETDRSAWKMLLLGLLGVAASAAAVSGFMNFSASPSPPYFWTFVVATLLFWALKLVQIFFVKGSWKLFSITLCEILVPLAVFRTHFDSVTLPYLLVAAILAFLFIGTAIRRGRNTVENSIEPQFFSVSKNVLPKLTSGFLIFISLLLYLNYFVWGNFTDTLGRAMLQSVTSTAEPVVHLWIPNVSFGMSVQTFIDTLVRGELERTNFTVAETGGHTQQIGFRELPPKQQELYFSQAKQQANAAFVAQFGDVNRNESVNTLLYDLGKEYIGKMGTAASGILSVAAIVLFFLSIKGVAVLLYWLIGLLGFIFFKLCLVTGFAVMSVETRTRRFPILP